MTHAKAVVCLKLLLFLHVVAQFRDGGQQQWPVPYRYEPRRPSPLRVGSALDREVM